MASPPDYHKYIIRQFMLNFKTKVGFLGTKIAIKKWYELRPTGSAERAKSGAAAPVRSSSVVGIKTSRVRCRREWHRRSLCGRA